MTTKTKPHEPETEQEQEQPHEQQEDHSPAESFRKYLSNADKAITETKATITSANERIEQAHERLYAIKEELKASEYVVDDFQRRVQILTPVLNQARLAEPLARGTGLEKEARSRVTSLESDLQALQQGLEKATAHHASHQAEAAKETSALQEQIESDTASIAEHTQLLRDLGEARAQAFEQLGPALRDERVAVVLALKKLADEQQERLTSVESQLLDAQKTLSDDLSAWPEVQQEAVVRHGRKMKKAQTATERKIRAFDSFLAELELSEEISEVQPKWSYRRVVELFQLDNARLAMLLNLRAGLTTWDRPAMDHFAAMNRVAVLRSLRQNLKEYLDGHLEQVRRGMV